MRTINKIITKMDCKYGAPMGRHNVDNRPISECNGVEFVSFNGTVFDCAVPLDNGGYDKGGAYWGIGKQLRVRYTKDLSYVEFYRR